ncbi:MAG: enoyl-CoA hydratase/isomerase family protein [Bacteroidetes bacterium]|nr:enoyl-CoA hydratase/isomerase family protein [Bacteroidota bacterium]MBS1972850.1 enoyl-CoA hydratase/isomerase family protein [Bacteroidota bacterium]
MQHEIQGGYVKVELHNGACIIEFFHPHSNSLPRKMLEGLATEIHAAGNNGDVKVVLLRSAGDKAFCGGASFDELLDIKTKEEGTVFFTGFAHVINEMRKCPKFIIVRIHGKCVGGGLGIAAAADYAIAAEGADIKLSELAFGIGPFVVGPAVERKIGLSAFTQLAIDAAMFRNADWARRKGLYAELHPDAGGMDESISRLMEVLAHYSPDAMSEMKKAFWHGTGHWDELLAERAAISGRLILSEYSKKALEKFKGKRK